MSIQIATTSSILSLNINLEGEFYSVLTPAVAYGYEPPLTWMVTAVSFPNHDNFAI